MNGALFLLFLIVLLLVVFVFLRRRGAVGGCQDEFLEARYAGNVGRSTVYVSPPDAPGGPHRYKVYPLCCEECRAHAQTELRALQQAQKEPRMARLLQHWTTHEHPRNGLRSSYPYLVIELEPVVSLPEALAAGRAVREDEFGEVARAVQTLSRELHRDLDSSFATIQVADRGPVVAQLDHPRFPKTSILEAFAPWKPPPQAEQGTR